MKSWAQQLAGTVLVVVFVLAVGGFVTILRAQQAGLGATMAAAHIRAVSPPDGATNVPINGDIRVDYVSQPSHDPIIKLEPPVGVTCLLYTSDAADDMQCVDLGGRRIIKKK